MNCCHQKLQFRLSFFSLCLSFFLPSFLFSLPFFSFILYFLLFFQFSLFFIFVLPSGFLLFFYLSLFFFFFFGPFPSLLFFFFFFLSFSPLPSVCLSRGQGTGVRLKCFGGECLFAGLVPLLQMGLFYDLFNIMNC